MTPLDYGRLLMALTLSVHSLFVIPGIGLALFISLAEFLGLRTRNENYLRMARTWSRGFALLFAVGAGSGVAVAVQLFLLWPTFMAVASQVIILPFFIEVFAFFTEAIFLGIYMYSWDRFKNPWRHWLASVPIVVASALSGFLITTVNAFMNAPTGFALSAGKLVHVDPVAAMLNTAVPYETSHVLLACYVGTSFMLGAIYAFKRLRGDSSEYAKVAFQFALSVGLVVAILAAITGSLSASFVASSQPEKFAAMEALYHTQSSASETFFGITIPIPGLLSFLATGSFNGVVTGLDAFPSSTWPDVGLVHTAFNVLVTIGLLLVLIALVNLVLVRLPARERLRRLSQFAVVAAGPLAYANFLLGWAVTEVGRQPWIIYNVMTVQEGFTAAGETVPALFFAFAAFYAALLGLTVVVLRRLYTARPREPKPAPGAAHG
ncbi:MAG TPA: cytochrome ubiquinol oxidase subunit I [Thermoplasmata archaeon]|nr:cytochrome ubiquinol oxidase subunit I [Thermoplasmata archaeon]